MIILTFLHENFNFSYRFLNLLSAMLSRVNETRTFDASSGVAAVDSLLLLAAGSGASDAHLDPQIEGLFVRFRIDGELEPAGVIPARLHEEVIARLKILSGARTDLHAVPQDGRWHAEIGGEPYNVRISFMPTYHGENAVIRLLPAAVARQDSFAALGFTPDHAAMIGRALTAGNGLILVTGPTGSGKTTTLRVCLGLVAKAPISVMTLEDPIEYEVPGVRHVHIRETHGVSFASGLRAALRQDPDVIMVGEIRDNETARTAVHTALTGHLVFSTLHTVSALEAVLRLEDMGVERFLLAATLRLVVGQRLARMICNECNGFGNHEGFGKLGDDERIGVFGESHIDSADRFAVDKAFQSVTRSQSGFGTELQSDVGSQSGVGAVPQSNVCKSCRGSGYLGRSVVAEVLEADAGLRELIGRGEPMSVLREYAVSHGFRPMSDDAGEKVDWGVTTREEVIRALYS